MIFGEFDLDLPKIVQAAAAAHGVSEADVLGRSRSKRIVAARQLAFYCAHRFTTMSYPEIGFYLRREHTTVMRGSRRIAAALAAHDRGVVDRLTQTLLSAAGHSEAPAAILHAAAIALARVPAVLAAAQAVGECRPDIQRAVAALIGALEPLANLLTEDL